MTWKRIRQPHLREIEELQARLDELYLAEDRKGRYYETSRLPVFKRTARTERRDAVSEAIYREVCSAWRMLTDVRFKLLGLIPVAALAGGLFTLREDQSGTFLWLRSAVALFGLAATVGVMMYERRNDVLYNDLISRGRRIESEWGVDTGLFLGRRTAGWVNHGKATWTVYIATLALWIAALAASVWPVVGPMVFHPAARAIEIVAPSFQPIIRS